MVVGRPHSAHLFSPAVLPVLAFQGFDAVSEGWVFEPAAEGARDCASVSGGLLAAW